MDHIISTIVKLFSNSGNSTAHTIATRLAHYCEYEFVEKFPPHASLQGLSSTLKTPNALPITRDIITMTDRLPWGQLNSHPPPGALVTGRTFCQLVGPEGLIKDDTIRSGVYFQSPQTFYQSHWHNAEEIYLVLSGTAMWQKDKTPFELQSPGTLIHHLPNQPHAMHAQDEPVLALWGWVGDIGFESYEIE